MKAEHQDFAQEKLLVQFFKSQKNIFVECPHCNKGFLLSSAKMWYGNIARDKFRVEMKHLHEGLLDLETKQEDFQNYVDEKKDVLSNDEKEFSIWKREELARFREKEAELKKQEGILKADFKQSKWFKDAKKRFC